LEGTFRGHLAQPPCREQGHLQLDQVAQNPIQPDLGCSQGRGLLYLSGQPVPVFHHPHRKNFLPISSLNLPSLSLKPLLRVLLLHALVKSPSPTFLYALQVLEGCYKVSLQPSLLQAGQCQLSQPFLLEEVLHPSDHFCGPPVDLLQQVHVLLMLGAPELNARLQVGSHQSGGAESPPLTCWPHF